MKTSAKSKNIKKKCSNKARKVCKNAENIIDKSVFDRRRQELLEIVTKENELYKDGKQKQSKEHVSVENFYDVAYLSSESSTDSSDSDITALRRSLQKRELDIKEVEEVSRDRAIGALDMLDRSMNDSKQTLSNEEKRINMLKKHCNKNSSASTWQLEGVHTWESSMYIIKAVRACILMNDWDNLTYLLLMLIDHHKAYIPYAKQVALLNLMVNRADCSGDLLDEFRELLMVS